MARIIFTIDRAEPTPGPWRVGVLKNCTDGFPDSLAVLPETTQKKKRGPAVCLVAALKGVDRVDEANAYLLAASPDMLAAIEAILLQVVQGKVLERDACISQARAAFAKAKGEVKP